MQPSSLLTHADRQLTSARQSPSGRSATTVYGGQAHVLRQTVLALVAGQSTGEHQTTGDATVHVLQGRVRLDWADAGCDGVAGDLIVVPAVAHSLHAVDDAVVLLTVARKS